MIAALAALALGQTFSAGLSVPLLEFQPGNNQPVKFAPGVGVEAGVGFFPTTIAGAQADLLNLSGVLFASAPGSIQAGATVGTFNNVVCIGAAIPLSANDGSGAFQGAFHVYPLLGGSVGFDLGSAPPATVGDGPGVKQRRFGTIYLGVLK